MAITCKTVLWLIFLLCFINFKLTAQINYASLKSVEVFPDENVSQTHKITNGYANNMDFWKSSSEILNRSIIIDLTADFQIGGAHLYMPSGNDFLPEKVVFQYLENDKWKTFIGGDLESNSSRNIRVAFKKTANTSKIRILFPDSYDLSISEICVWGESLPQLWEGISKDNLQKFKPNEHWVCVNQVAYNKDAPKGFTVPTAISSLEFAVINIKENKIEFRGKLNGKKGDFSDFRPKSSLTDEYRICVMDSLLGNADSYPFVIGEQAIQKMSYQSAVDFMNDARSFVGTHPSAYGGCPWRDGAYYTFEVPSMVMMYLSNPEAFKSMPVTINFNKEKDYIFSHDFKPTKEPSDEKSMSIVRSYYEDLPTPKDLNAPDIIQAIRYGIGWYLIDPVTKDPSGDPLGWQLHSQTVEQFAYFLYGYPAFKEFISEDLYNKVLNKTLKLWGESGLFNVITNVGTPKGRHCAGHSILPNLLMYEVAKREKIEKKDSFLQAAINQAQWIIENVDWKDPKFTKGQRMSEPRLVTGLTHFLYNYPELAPKGLQNKINEWAAEVIRLSDNEWDFRRFDLKENWTVPVFNEVGNVIGFPACALSVAMVVNNTEVKDRLVQIAYAHIDNFNGRNPANAHCANHPDQGFLGVDSGWEYGDPRRDICARLETVRGALCSLPGSEMYPFNPFGQPRHGEGWSVYNANWNTTLAYLNFYEGVSSLKVLRNISIINDYNE